MRALCILANGSETRNETLMGADAHVTVLAGMQAHAGSAGVQKRGKDILYELGSDTSTGAYLASAFKKTKGSRRRDAIKEAQRQV